MSLDLAALASFNASILILSLFLVIVFCLTILMFLIGRKHRNPEEQFEFEILEYCSEGRLASRPSDDAAFDFAVAANQFPYLIAAEVPTTAKTGILIRKLKELVKVGVLEGSLHQQGAALRITDSGYKRQDFLKTQYGMAGALRFVGRFYLSLGKNLLVPIVVSLATSLLTLWIGIERQ